MILQFCIDLVVAIIPIKGHIKNIHLHRCKHKTVKLKLTLILTLTLSDTGGAVLTHNAMIQKKELQIKTEEDGNFKAEKYQIEIEVNILNTTPNA